LARLLGGRRTTASYSLLRRLPKTSYPPPPMGIRLP
jgi:hypothetical protein